MFPFLLIILIAAGCASQENSLEKVKGVDVTYNEYFKPFDQLDERKNIQFYKPIAIEEIRSSLDEQIWSAGNGIASDALPFEVDEEQAYLVTSKEEMGEVKNQVQLSYMGNSEYGDVDSFFIISVTEVGENPIKEYDFPEVVDSVGNELKKEILIDNVPIFQQVLTTDSALLYRYYKYNEAEKKVTVVGTAANEFYSYYDGFVYHIGYSIDREKNTAQVQEDMLNLTRKFILDNDL